ncbi:MAG: helix-hairpin-helix domain-containing protein [Deltaproteobacteria bacterium]
MAHRVAIALLVLAALLPTALRRLPSRRARPCEIEGRGTEPFHWLGCRGDSGAERPLRGLELVLLGRTVDIDRANAEDLAAVPGIGHSLAMDVVRDREERGPFLHPDELRRVRGIGPVRLERARPYIRASSP